MSPWAETYWILRTLLETHSLRACRLINNKFTVDGIKQLAEALADNTALKEIWWGSGVIDISLMANFFKKRRKATENTSRFNNDNTRFRCMDVWNVKLCLCLVWFLQREREPTLWRGREPVRRRQKAAVPLTKHATCETSVEQFLRGGREELRGLHMLFLLCTKKHL